LRREKENCSLALALLDSDIKKKATERDKLQQELKEQQIFYEQRLGELKAEIKKLTDPPPAPEPPPTSPSRDNEEHHLQLDSNTLNHVKRYANEY
jgi:hypothetical protein